MTLPALDVDIDELCVLAGTPCSGKSYLIGQLLRGESLGVAQKLGLQDCGAWEATSFSRALKERAIRAPRLLLEFDILYGLRRRLNHQIPDFDALRALFAGSKVVSVVSLWAPLDAMRRRLIRRAPSLLRRTLREKGFVKVGRVWRDVRMVSQLYRRPDEVLAEYESWIDLLRPLDFRAHWVVDTSSESIIQRLEQPADFASVVGLAPLAVDR